MEKLGQEHYTAETGLEYIRQKFGIEIEGLYGKHPANARSTIRALQVLWDYNEYGSMVVKIRPRCKGFECPAQFAMDFVESIQSEGVELERKAMGEGTKQKAPIIVEIDAENEQKNLQDLDIQLPIIQSEDR